jgi:hypothetical protein
MTIHDRRDDYPNPWRIRVRGHPARVRSISWREAIRDAVTDAYPQAPFTSPQLGTRCTGTASRGRWRRSPRPRRPLGSSGILGGLPFGAVQGQAPSGGPGNAERRGGSLCTAIPRADGSSSAAAADLPRSAQPRAGGSRGLDILMADMPGHGDPFADVVEIDGRR